MDATRVDIFMNSNLDENPQMDETNINAKWERLKNCLNYAAETQVGIE